MQFLFLHKSIDQRRLVVFGRSLGGAVATHLATVPMYAARISCVILENTFVDLPAIAACVFGVKALGRLPRWCYKNKVIGSDECAIDGSTARLFYPKFDTHPPLRNARSYTPHRYITITRLQPPPPTCLR